jgi:subtilisin family serine protease
VATLAALLMLLLAGGKHSSAAAPRAGYLWVPNDPLYSRQQPYLQSVGVERAWNTQRGDPSIIVAVIDSGVDTAHPDLQDAIWQNPSPDSTCGVHGCNVLDPDSVDPTCRAVSADPGDVSPTYPHGTFLAGIIAARADNGLGIAGVAPYATIMPVRAGDCKGVVASAEARGIDAATAHGARIINLSIGQEDCHAAPPYLASAIARAEAADVLVIAAAGNADRDCLSAPGNVAGVLTVTATTADGTRRASFSDWATIGVGLVAPGVGVVGTLPSSGDGSHDYAAEDGTSFAAPIVAGAAALVLSQNPWLTASQAAAILLASAKPLAANGAPGWAGSGLLQADAALALVPQALSGYVTQGGQSSGAGVAVDAFVNGTPCGSTTTYDAADGGAGYLLDVAADAAQTGCGTPGATVTITVAGQFAGTAQWQPRPVWLDLASGAAVP